MADVVNGSCEPAFNRVRDLLQEKLTSGEELGASLCVSVDGKNVLDLWGGHADAEKSRPWEEDTVTVVWSCSKVVTALAALTLIDRGLLDPEERVSKYWPEFGVNGKEDIRVWHIFSHSSGLCTWEKPITTEFLLDTPASTIELAKQAPLFEPGSASGYQMQTHGHLIGELVRRISGKPLKQFIADEIAGPLGADFRLGVPEEDWSRTADVVSPPPMNLPEGADMQSINMRTFTNPFPDAKISETPAFRAADVGASNGFANARALARIGSLVSLKGTVDGKQYLAPKTVDQMVQERISGVDLVLGLNLRIGLGVGLPVPNLSFLPEGNIAFWGGWGGSLIVMDLDRRMTIAYVMNKMAHGTLGNANAQAYVKEIYEIMETRKA
jgi:CubicO group peptidase (beta-lactamase class C family)